jgi:hypothetical protein
MVFAGGQLSIGPVASAGSPGKTHALWFKGNVSLHIQQCPMVQGPYGTFVQWHLLCCGIHPMLEGRSRSSVADPKKQETTKKPKKSGWLWPAGAMATGLAGVAVLLLRGCWHRKMSWPVRAQGYAYQVCLGCGVKRLFDESYFRSYGPFHYDLTELIAWENSQRPHPIEAPKEKRPAS